MLVVLSERILSAAKIKRGRGVLVILNHLLAAAGITGQRKGAQPFVGGKDAGGHERLDQRDESRRMTTRIGNALGGGDLLAACG